GCQTRTCRQFFENGKADSDKSVWRLHVKTPFREQLIQAVMLTSVNRLLTHEPGYRCAQVVVCDAVSELSNRLHEVALAGRKEAGQHGKEGGGGSVTTVKILRHRFRKAEIDMAWWNADHGASQLSDRGHSAGFFHKTSGCRMMKFRRCPAMSFSCPDSF